MEEVDLNAPKVVVPPLPDTTSASASPVPKGDAKGEGFMPLVMVVGFHHARFVTRCFTGKGDWEGRTELIIYRLEDRRSKAGSGQKKARIQLWTTTGLSSPSWL